jgi:transcriptional regulator with XRE-family HTH domain
MQNKSQNTQLGEILRLGREKKKLSQQELAKILNVSNKTISAWELKRREPNIETFIKIVIILDLYKNFFPFTHLPNCPNCGMTMQTVSEN